MKNKNDFALTLTLSHLMGGGTAMGVFGIANDPVANPAARYFRKTASDSPSSIRWERAGVGVKKARIAALMASSRSASQ